ncbi:two-component sensor histidine kinase [Bordetella genomosp. 12]|uniref:histidine kinase n=2 Tax=Bordetella genomosp. 12 TaxID=463035 RepID=A0A261VC78_9BORD|nr:two-component sensor histidine kinase [Bordetella genomosp. 12]
MAPDSRLSRHLVLTYLCLSIAVGAVLSALSLWTVVKLEEHLQRIDMGMAVERVRGDFLAGKDIGRAERFFHGEPGSTAFPDWLRGISAGFHKLEHGGRIWHAMADDHAGTRYVLLRDYTEYEHSQLRSHWVTVAALAGSLLAAFGLGALASRRFVRPLLKLAEQVGSRPGLPPRTRLAQAYPANEIGQLAQAFDETYNQLEQALERERLFTADVSHELRTPLMVIASSAEVLDDAPGLPAEVRTQAMRIRKAATEMQQHLQAHLMLARGAAPASGFAQASARDVVQEECRRWLPRAEALGLQLQCRAGADSTLLWPAALLHVVVSNLIRNALQHAQGAGWIGVSAEDDCIAVEDDGPGIAAERQEALFAPFVSGPGGTSENLGLGLSLVQRICQHQGWRIELDAAPDRGCRFRIWLAPVE